MPPDDLYARWRGIIERIYRETVYIFSTRDRFREVEKLFAENPRLHKTGAHVYEWLFGMWGRDALMGVRRELDGQGGTVNLCHLLHEIKARPDVLTRRRYLAHDPKGDDFLQRLLNRGFDSFSTLRLDGWKDANDDVIDPARVAADLRELQDKAAVAFNYAQRMVAQPHAARYLRSDEGRHQRSDGRHRRNFQEVLPNFHGQHCPPDKSHASVQLDGAVYVRVEA